MTDTPRPWDRLTTDSAPAYEAFAAYLDTGSRRDAYRHRSGNEQAPPSPRRDRQSARRHAAIREQRPRLREHLIHPGVLERHQVRALHLRLAPKLFHLRGHVVPNRACRDVRHLLQGPLDADPVRVGIRVGPVLGELRRDRAVAGAGQPILHDVPTSKRQALFASPFGRDGTGLDTGFCLRAGDLGSDVRCLPSMAFTSALIASPGVSRCQ